MLRLRFVVATVLYVSVGGEIGFPIVIFCFTMVRTT
jgi:hypothetical protein